MSGITKNEGYKLIQPTMDQYALIKNPFILYDNKGIVIILLYLYLSVSCCYEEERNINKLYVCKIDNRKQRL